MFSPGPTQYIFHTLIAQYSLLVLKVPLNTNQPTTNQPAAYVLYALELNVLYWRESNAFRCHMQEFVKLCSHQCIFNEMELEKLKKKWSSWSIPKA